MPAVLCPLFCNCDSRIRQKMDGWVSDEVRARLVFGQLQKPPTRPSEVRSLFIVSFLFVSCSEEQDFVPDQRLYPDAEDCSDVAVQEEAQASVGVLSFSFFFPPFICAPLFGSMYSSTVLPPSFPFLLSSFHPFLISLPSLPG